MERNYLEAQEERKNNGSKDTDRGKGRLGIRRFIEASEEENEVGGRVVVVVVVKCKEECLVGEGEVGHRRNIQFCKG